MNKTKSTISSTLFGIFVWQIAAFFFLYEFFLRTVSGSLAHNIMMSLKLNAETFSFIASAYYFTYGVMQLPVGILADKFGVKKIMLFAVLICAGSAFLFGQSTGFYSALISRLLMGFGSSFAFVCLLVVVTNWFQRKYFGFLSGVSQFIGTMGPLIAAGPLVSLIHVSHASWRAALAMSGVFGLILAVFVFFFVKNHPKSGERKFVFLIREKNFLTQLILLLKNKQAWLVAVFSAAVYTPIALIGAFWGTIFFQAKGFSQSASASLISVAWLGYAIGCPLLGYISDKTRRRKPVLIFAAGTGFVVTMALIYLPLVHAYLFFIVLLFLLGISASGQNVGFAIIGEHTRSSVRAAAMGLNNMAIILSSAIFPILAGFFIHHASITHPQHLLSSDFTVGFSLMPFLYGLAFVLMTSFIKETFCRQQKEVLKVGVSNQRAQGA